MFDQFLPEKITLADRFASLLSLGLLRRMGLAKRSPKASVSKASVPSGPSIPVKRVTTANEPASLPTVAAPAVDRDAAAAERVRCASILKAALDHNQVPLAVHLMASDVTAEVACEVIAAPAMRMSSRRRPTLHQLMAAENIPSVGLDGPPVPEWSPAIAAQAIVAAAASVREAPAVSGTWVDLGSPGHIPAAMTPGLLIASMDKR